MKIELKPWNYECGDGCCSESGVDVYVDGVYITDHGEMEHILIRSLLDHLGYKEIEIIGFDIDGEESWDG